MWERGPRWEQATAREWACLCLTCQLTEQNVTKSLAAPLHSWTLTNMPPWIFPGSNTWFVCLLVMNTPKRSITGLKYTHFEYVGRFPMLWTSMGEQHSCLYCESPLNHHQQPALQNSMRKKDASFWQAMSVPPRGQSMNCWPIYIAPWMGGSQWGWQLDLMV